MNSLLSKNLLPYTVIAKAKQGDTVAMGQVLQHYSGYIASMARKIVFDEYGNPHIYVDEYIRTRLENKLINAIVTDFKSA
jgi:hypothetical protein